MPAECWSRVPHHAYISLGFLRLRSLNMALPRARLDKLIWLFGSLADELELSDREARALACLTDRLLEKGSLSYEDALSSAGDEDALLLAFDLGLALPVRADSRCLEWDSSPLGPGSSIRLNPAAGAAIRAFLEGREVREGLADLFLDLGVEGHLAYAMAELSLALSGRGSISGLDIASACRSLGLEGLEDLSVAVLKAAGVISPVLSSSWPSGDVRYRTCKFLALLARAAGPSGP